MDKLVHAGLYSVLGATLGWGRRRDVSPPPHWVLLGVGALYGATDEWHQGFVRGRVPDWGDWFADVAGVTLGYWGIVWVLGWLARRKEETRTKVVDVSQ